MLKINLHGFNLCIIFVKAYNTEKCKKDVFGNKYVNSFNHAFTSLVNRLFRLQGSAAWLWGNKTGGSRLNKNFFAKVIQ